MQHRTAPTLPGGSQEQHLSAPGHLVPITSLQTSAASICPRISLESLSLHIMLLVKVPVDRDRLGGRVFDGISAPHHL